MAGYRMKAGQRDSSELPEVPADWSLLLGPDMEAVLVTWSRQIFCVSQSRWKGGLYVAVVFFVALSVFWEGTIQNSAIAMFLSEPEISAPNFRQVFTVCSCFLIFLSLEHLLFRHWTCYSGPLSSPCSPIIPLSSCLVCLSLLYV